MSFARSKIEQFDITDPFEVFDIKKTDNGIRLTVQTEDGPKTLNCPKWINIYMLHKDGQTKIEAWIPEWLCQKAGLI